MLYLKIQNIFILAYDIFHFFVLLNSINYRKTQFLVPGIRLIRESEKYNFALLILFYDKVMRQKFIFHLPGIIPGTKNRIFRY